jgi:hypothetical protein
MKTFKNLLTFLATLLKSGHRFLMKAKISETIPFANAYAKVAVIRVS